MIENVIREIGGVGLFGVISICLFAAVFVGVLIRVICLKKDYLETMRELPLADGGDPTPPHLTTKDCHG